MFLLLLICINQLDYPERFSTPCNVGSCVMRRRCPHCGQGHVLATAEFANQSIKCDASPFSMSTHASTHALPHVQEEGVFMVVKDVFLPFPNLQINQ